jgi:heterotetrameric sarcosine oxidase delta subunit
MASLIHCPHCGVRPRDEFTIKGDATVHRPAVEASDKEWSDYVFIRSNPVGLHKEYWQHLAGCRRWLIVERDTVSHQVFSVTDAQTTYAGGEA